MPTNKRATKKSSRNIKGGPGPLQTDDPIIVKPGGSLTLEWDNLGFTDDYNPGGKKKGKKHNKATAITRVVILDKSDNVKTRLEITDPKDRVMICYAVPNGCSCK